MKKYFIILLLLVFSISFSYAGNVDTFGIGSKATALGGAFSAYADDPFAAYYNPAGLVQMKSFTASAGVHILNPNLKIYDYSATDGVGNNVSPYGQDFGDKSPTLIVPHIGFATPINDRIAFGLAAYVPYGLHVKWEDNPAQNAGAYNSYESYYYRLVVSPTIAYKVNDKFSIGFGISVGRSESGVYRRIYNDATINTLNNLITTYSINCNSNPTNIYCQKLAVAQATNGKKIETDVTDSVNWSYNVGIMYKPMDQLTLGLTYRSRTHTKFKGETEIKGLDPITETTLNKARVYTSVDVNFSVDHPEQIQLGIRYQPHKRVSIEADVVWTNWSIIDQYTANFEDPLLSSTEKETFPRKWEDTKQVRVGIEWMVTDLLTLRAGYFYDPSPIPDDTFDLVWPDADKKVYSLGAGLNFGRLSIDLVLQYIVAEYQRQIGGESENLNDTYADDVTGNEGEVSMKADGNLWGYGVTLNYKF
ncbi:OmpP1/FadL family transporter [Deferribacter abyssi]|uniref:OmpP1/FadL family transporter n=1 Tax=Deferribacter abyssi TaxID=213806 RepID=UPI003C1AE8B6